MGEVGAIRSSKELGHKGKHRWIWATCPDCKKERWVQLRKGFENLRCRSCAGIRYSKTHTGKDCLFWKGGRTKLQGYILIKLYPDNFFYPMATHQGYVLEHRLIMARYLGRCLQPWEIVHHKNHDKQDNRIENLQLVSDDRHNQITILESRVKYLEQRVTLLEAENIRLKMQENEV